MLSINLTFLKGIFELKKRTAELVTGLVGSILGTIISIFLFIFALNLPAVESTANFLVGSFMIMVIQVIALILSCCVNSMNNKLYGVLMIFTGAISLFVSFLALLIPGVLYIVSGGIAFRTLENKTDKHVM
ncbi:hypothetical protein CON34_05770 [Bacillus thuringiensis]|nr:hypothetical protein CON34_05770 [Bacillus thuringiensis]